MTTADDAGVSVRKRLLAVLFDTGVFEIGTEWKRLIIADAILAAGFGDVAEAEWEYGSRDRTYTAAISLDQPSGWSMAVEYPEDYERIRRRKVGPWEAVRTTDTNGASE